MLLVACGETDAADGARLPVSDGGGSAPDPDAAAYAEGGVPTSDAGEPARCAPGETRACAELAALWSGGTATCRSSGNGYDVSRCQRGGPDPAARAKETVYPAQRGAAWSNAKCNLGDDFVFDISYPPVPAGAPLPKSWVISLEGGGFCAFDGDKTTVPGGCSDRELELVSSKGAPADRTVEVDPPIKNVDLRDAIVAHGQYCSSDLWTGANPQGTAIHYQDGSLRPWAFTGHLNVEAMLDVLVERYGLDDDASISILLKGASAGGRGAFNNAHVLKRRFPKTAAAGNVLIAPGAGFVPLSWDDPGYPILGIGSGNAAFGSLTTTWKSTLTPSCLAAHGANDPAHPPHECISGPVLYDFLTGPEPAGMDLPVLVFQNRQDQLYMRIAGLPPSGYRQTFRSGPCGS